MVVSSKSKRQNGNDITTSETHITTIVYSPTTLPNTQSFTTRHHEPPIVPKLQPKSPALSPASSPSTITSRTAATTKTMTAQPKRSTGKWEKESARKGDDRGKDDDRRMGESEGRKDMVEQTVVEGDEGKNNPKGRRKAPAGGRNWKSRVASGREFF